MTVVSFIPITFLSAIVLLITTFLAVKKFCPSKNSLFNAPTSLTLSIKNETFSTDVMGKLSVSSGSNSGFFVNIYRNGVNSVVTRQYFSRIGN